MIILIGLLISLGIALGVYLIVAIKEETRLIKELNNDRRKADRGADNHD